MNYREELLRNRIMGEGHLRNQILGKGAPNIDSEGVWHKKVCDSLPYSLMKYSSYKEGSLTSRLLPTYHSTWHVLLGVVCKMRVLALMGSISEIYGTVSHYFWILEALSME